MEPKWYVDVSNTETGSKLFEPFDYEQYTQLQQDYFRLSGKEKGVYRGIYSGREKLTFKCRAFETKFSRKR